MMFGVLDGSDVDFVAAVKACLVEQYGYSTEKAEEFVSSPAGQEALDLADAAWEADEDEGVTREETVAETAAGIHDCLHGDAH